MSLRNIVFIPPNIIFNINLHIICNEQDIQDTERIHLTRQWHYKNNMKLYVLLTVIFSWESVVSWLTVKDNKQINSWNSPSVILPGFWSVIKYIFHGNDTQNTDADNYLERPMVEMKSPYRYYHMHQINKCTVAKLDVLP